MSNMKINLYTEAQDQDFRSTDKVQYINQNRMTIILPSTSNQDSRSLIPFSQ